MAHEEDDLSVDEVAMIEEREQEARSALPDDRQFRRGVCHGMEAAIRLVNGYEGTAEGLRESLRVLADVMIDWRNGTAERDGFSGNPWEWDADDYDRYVKEHRDQW